MYSEEAKLVFGLDPSGLFEKVILAPEIGFPRASPPTRTGSDESEVEITVSGVFVVTGESFLGSFGIVTLIGNCPTAGSVKNEASAIAAISKNEDLTILSSLLGPEFQ